MKKLEQLLPICLGILLLFPLFFPLTKLGVLPFLMLVIAVVYCVRKKKIRHWPIVLFLFSFVIRFFVISIINTPIVSDFKTMYEAARQINLGNIISVQNSPYFQLWGYQWGHTLYMSFFLKCIPSVFFLKVLNIFFSSGSIVLLYLIGKDFVKERVARGMSLLYVFFPFPLLLNTVLTNQHHATFFFLLALYFLISKKHRKDVAWKKGLLVGTFLAISNLLRPEAITFLVAFIAYLIFDFSRKKAKACLQLGATTFVAYLLITISISSLLQITHISPSGLQNKDPYWRFIVGLNPQSRGQYSEEDEKTYTFGDKKQALSIIKERSIGNITQLPRLFLQKETILWTQSDLSWSIGHFPREGNSDLYYFLTNLNQCFIYFFLITGIIGCFSKIKERECLFFILLLGVYFGVYLFTEVMPRYAYTPQTILLLLGMLGVNAILEKIEVRLSETRQN